jgi:hypothetical protein
MKGLSRAESIERKNIGAYRGITAGLFLIIVKGGIDLLCFFLPR